jgi:hypothetical protein
MQIHVTHIDLFYARAVGRVLEDDYEQVRNGAFAGILIVKIFEWMPPRRAHLSSCERRWQDGIAIAW